MPDEIIQGVKDALASVKKIPSESIALENTLESLRVDSLDKVMLLFELEKTFDLNIPDESAHQIRTVADIVAGIQQLRAASSADAAAAR